VRVKFSFDLALYKLEIKNKFHPRPDISSGNVCPLPSKERDYT